MELEKSRNLTVTLENDLEKVQQEASNAFPSSAMSVAGTYTSRYPQSSFAGGRRGRSSPTSSIISGFDPTKRLRIRWKPSERVNLWAVGLGFYRW